MSLEASLEAPLVGSINAPSAPKDVRKAAGLPGLDQQVLISWVFIQASVFLLGGFIFLQIGIHNPDSYFAQWPNVGNMTFMASCLGWFLGFVLLTHWTVYSIGDTSSAGFFGTLLKLVAAVFFNMQPISAMWEEDAGGITAASQSEFAPATSFGLGWTNFLGIWYHALIFHRVLVSRVRWTDRMFARRSLFHTGNVFSVYAMMKPANGLFDYGNKFCHGNLPVWGMWVYLSATTFLGALDSLLFVVCVSCTDLCCNMRTVTANALAYFADQGTIADEYGLGWAFTAACQIIGSSLLLVGSLIYLYYSTATNERPCACISPC